jgi:hypothetical protein
MFTLLRIALEHGDMNELNQCQRQIALLKAEGLPIQDDESTCYIILHLLFRQDLLYLAVSYTYKVLNTVFV